MTFHHLLERGRHLVDAWSRDTALLATLRSLLEHGYEPVLQGLLLLTLLCAALSLPSWVRLARRLSGTTLLGVVALFNAALMLRLHWAPHKPQVYFDEILFLDTAANLANHGLNVLSLLDGVRSGPEFHPCPQGWQFLISRVYYLAGCTPEHAFTLAAWLSSLTVVAMFAAAYLLTASERAGLWAALLLAVLPVHLRLSGSAALETASAFFLCSVIAAAMLAIEERRLPLALLTGCLLAWFVNIRMENSFVLFPLLLVGFVVICPSEALAPWKMRLGGAAALFVAQLLSAPALLADYYGLATHFYYFYATPSDIASQVDANLLGNARFWLANTIHPLLVTALAAVGFVATPQRRLAWSAGLWWLILVLFYSFNPSCDFSLSHTLDSWRTALHPTLGLVLLAALGADIAVGWLAPRQRLATALLALWSALIPFGFGSFVQGRSLWMVAWDLQREMQSQLPADARLLVFDCVPQLGFHSTALAQDIAWTCGIIPEYIAMPEHYEGRAGEPLPQMAAVIDSWAKVEKRPLFLYLLNTGSSIEAEAEALVHRTLRLRTVLQAREPSSGATFTFSRIDGAAIPPQATQRPGRLPASKPGSKASPTSRGGQA